MAGAAGVPYGLGRSTPRRAGSGLSADPGGVSVSPGSQGNRFRTIVITGPGQGIFVYSGAPAFGSLTETLGISVAGTDGQGNAYLAGDTTYQNVSGTFVAFQKTAVSLTWLTAATAAGPYISTGASITYATGTATLFIKGGTNGITLQSGTTIQGGLTVNSSFTATGGDAASPTLISTDTWNTVTVFGAGFAAGAPVPQYALMPFGVGAAASVAIRGQVLATAATAVGATMFTVPYTFARTHDYVTPNNLAGAALGQRIVRVNTSGAIGCQAIGANTNFVIIDGIIANMG
jgi:hypothetical protein